MPCSLGRSLSRPVLGQVVGVGAVENRVEPALARDFAESGPELGLAEVAAIGGIGTIARIGQLTGFHFEQRNIEAPSQIDGGSVLRPRDTTRFGR